MYLSLLLCPLARHRDHLFLYLYFDPSVCFVNHVIFSAVLLYPADSHRFGFHGFAAFECNPLLFRSLSPVMRKCLGATGTSIASPHRSVHDVANLSSGDLPQEDAAGPLRSHRRSADSARHSRHHCPAPLKN